MDIAHLKDLLLESRAAALAAKLSGDMAKATASGIAQAVEELGKSGDESDVAAVCKALRQEQELLLAERNQARLLMSRHKHQMELAIERGDAAASALALQNLREQKDKIKAVTHELKSSIEELRSKLAAIALGE